MKKLNVLTSMIVLLAMSALTAGCTTQRETFANHTPNQVWTAMQAVAESPEYEDWHLTMNEVWVDEEQSRIEVYRELRRTLHRPRSRTVNQRRTFRLQFVLESQDPPTVRFVSRGWGVPAHAMKEGDRYLVDVRRMLQSEFAASGAQPAEPPQEAQPAAADSEHVPEMAEDDLN